MRNSYLSWEQEWVMVLSGGKMAGRIHSIINKVACQKVLLNLASFKFTLKRHEIKILSFISYRAIMNAEAKREKERDKKRRQREKLKLNKVIIRLFYFNIIPLFIAWFINGPFFIPDVLGCCFFKFID